MSPQTRQPLTQYMLFESNSVDEIQQNLCDFYGESKVRIEPIHRQRRLPHALFAATLGGIELTSLNWPEGAVGSAPQLEGIFDFCSAFDGTATVTVGTRNVAVEKSRGVILSPHRPFRFCASDGSVHLNVKVPQRTIESHFRALTGHTIDEPLEFDEALRFNDPRLASLWRFVRFMADEVDRDENVLEHPLIAERFAETILTTLLDAQPHNYSSLFHKPAPPAAPSYVRRAEDYMETHCDEPIHAGSLAAAVGVSVRTLYAGFRKYRDCTPIGFLRLLRLRRARDTFLLAKPETTVNECAMKWGFTHPGRFSSLYRNQFGENPSETLRRSRDRQ